MLTGEKCGLIDGIQLIRDIRIIGLIKSLHSKDIGQDGARNAVVGARDGARQDGQGVEELGGEVSGKTGILHTHLDADGAPLGGIEVCNLANQVAQDVT